MLAYMSCWGAVGSFRRPDSTSHPTAKQPPTLTPASNAGTAEKGASWGLCDCLYDSRDVMVGSTARDPMGFPCPKTFAHLQRVRSWKLLNTHYMPVAPTDENATSHVRLTRRQQMEVELGLDLLRAHVDDDRVTGIVTACAARTDVHLLTQDVSEFSWDTIGTTDDEQKVSTMHRIQDSSIT